MPNLKLYKDKDKKEPLEYLDFADLIVNDGTTVEVSAYLVNESPNDYEVFEVTHPNPDTKFIIDFGAQTNKILKPNTPYKLTFIWSPPKDNDKKLEGKVTINGRYIIHDD